MKDFINIINSEINKIENVFLDERINNTDRAISMYLLSVWKKRLELNTIQNLANELNISVSGISKYLKKYNIQNFPVLRFLFKINNTNNNTNYIKSEQNIINASMRIINSNRVLLVGTGNSGLMAKAFYTRLVLNEINAIYVEGKPDQISMMKKMTNKDTIICISMSLSHEWTKNLLKSNKKLILFTNQKIANTDKINVFYPEESYTLKYSEIDPDSFSYINKKIEEIIINIKKIKDTKNKIP